MLVGNSMSTPPRVAAPETPVSEALRTMQEQHIRRLPVVDAKGRLVGIVSDKDLLHAAPSPATSLSVWEITYLLGRLTVAEVMTRAVLTVGPQTPIEDAAQLMLDRKIGGLPVVDGGKVVGVITETDVFRVFAELLGAHEPGARVTMTVSDRPGALAKVTGAVAEAGGSVSAMCTYGAVAPETRNVFLKVVGLSAERLEAILGPIVLEVSELADATGAES